MLSVTWLSLCLRLISLSCCLLWPVVAIRWCCSFAVGKGWGRAAHCSCEALGLSAGPQKWLCGSCWFRASVALLLWRATCKCPGKVGRTILIQLFRADRASARRAAALAVWAGSLRQRRNYCNSEETHVTPFLLLHSEPFGWWYVLCQALYWKLGWTNPSDKQGDLSFEQLPPLFLNSKCYLFVWALGPSEPSSQFRTVGDLLVLRNQVQTSIPATIRARVTWDWS